MDAHTTPLQRAWADLRVFFAHWKVPPNEAALLLGISNETYETWELTGSMSLNERIVARCRACYEIHRALISRMPEHKAYAWVQTPQSSDPFKGRTVIQTLCDEWASDPDIVQRIVRFVHTM